MGRFRALLGLVAMVVVLVAGAWLVPALAECAVAVGDPVCTPPSAGNDAPAAAQLLALINADRASAGLPLMVSRDDVTAIAVAHSTAMAEAGDIWHNDAYFTAETKRRLAARTVGENVALNRSTVDAHQRLMASPGHHANLVNPKFTVVGLAVVRDAGGMGYITEDFVEPLPSGAGSPGSADPAPAPPAPAPGPGSASGGGGGGGGRGTVSAQSASAPPAAPAPAPAPRSAPRAIPAPTGEAAAIEAAPVDGGEDRHHELARGSASATAATPSPQPPAPAHVPLWATLVAAFGLVAISGRMLLRLRPG